ncbi:MAG: TIGR04283 family arsenosugar biosynthesis glycosyltransferase [Balneolales bacterium]
MISVIIPTFQEEENIGRLMACLKKEAIHPGGIREIIVVDAGSRDETVRIAKKAGACCLAAAKKGRASQMNEGAKAAGGPILYFLHADTLPPPGFAGDIIGAVKQGKKAGCFRLAFDERHVLLSLYGWFTRFHLKAFRFGDQSQFITKSLFEQIGGFDASLTVMEDQEITGRIMNHCAYTVIPKNVITSARKYKQNGIVRLQLIYTLLFTLYYCRVSQDKLISLYKRLIR